MPRPFWYPEMGVILIVDDEEEVAKALRRYLSMQGYTCDWAADGVAAIERMRREPVPELVLLDYRMPGADGLEVLRCIRSQAMTAEVPVVMMSGDLRQCPNGAQALLEKPFSMSTLLAMIQKLTTFDTP